MKRLTALLLLAAMPLLSAIQIIVPKDAIPSEQTAARELAKYLQLLSEEKVDVTISNDILLHGKGVIHVGKSPATMKGLRILDWNALQQDEIFYACGEDGTIWIAGHGTRGTLYAVYEFLEREYGVRFLTDFVEHIPAKPTLELPKPGTTCHYRTPFIARVAYYDLALHGDYDFAAKTRTNAFRSIPEEWGYADGIIGFCHTLDRYLPESLFKDHPDYFSMVDGVRNAGPGSQPCLSHPEVRNIVTRQVLEALRNDDGKTHFISVSQNDNKRYCQCDRCNAFVAEHGNQTDLLIDFVNQIADEVAIEFPGIYVETLSYNYTRQPPKTVIPRDNVAIRFCTIEAFSFYPLESPENQNFADELLAWSKIANKLLIWNYLATFTKYYLPHPNWNALAKDIRFFRKVNAINIFEQGSFNGSKGLAELADLRTYVVSRLLWNPDLETKELVDEFCNLYYGPGAEVVKDYIETTCNQVAIHGNALDTCYPLDTKSFMTDAEIAAIWRRFYDGAMKLKDDPTYGPRMAVALLPLTMNLFDRLTPLGAAPEKRPPELADIDARELLDWTIDTIRYTGATKICESGNADPNQWITRMKGCYLGEISLPVIPLSTDKPEQNPFPEGTQWWAWEIEELAEHRFQSPGGAQSERTVMIADDPNAAGGKAVTLPNIHNEWFVQLTAMPRGSYDVYFSVRCDLKPGVAPGEAGDAISLGNYAAGPEMTVAAGKIAGPEYKLIHLGRSNLAEAIYFYIAPVINDKVERVWIDRMFVASPESAAKRPVEKD